MRKPMSVATLNDFGRIRLSKTFFMRDFLFSDIAAINELPLGAFASCLRWPLRTDFGCSQ